MQKSLGQTILERTFKSVNHICKKLNVTIITIRDNARYEMAEENLHESGLGPRDSLYLPAIREETRAYLSVGSIEYFFFL